jgi:signal transduction histidine kinase
MKGNYDQFSGLTQEELIQLCAELQDKVTKTISLKQELIGIKNDLDQELNRFRMIEEFGREGIFQDSIDSFGVHAVESFVQVFEQPHCLVAEYSPENKRLQILNSFGFNDIDIPKYVAFDAQYLVKKEGFFLQQETYLNDIFQFLRLQDALIGPFFDSNGKFSGLIICGQMSKDKLFYSPIKPNDRHAYTVMSRKAGYLLQNFRYNQKLKLEIEIRAAIEKELEAKANDLMRSNKDLEQFAYIVSHDLKAPLLNIAGFAQLLDSKYRDALDKNGQEYLNYILEGVQRFKGVIDALLQFSRNVRAAEQKENVVLNQIFENIQRSFAFTINSRQADIQVADLPNVHANKDLLQQLFQNLISNALKFTPEECIPKIVVDAKEREEDFLIRVADNGIGIEEDFLKDIFVPFRRLNQTKEFEGNGIGLSICKKIIEQHNGKIWADSEGLGQGTTFYVSLPK